MTATTLDKLAPSTRVKLQTINIERTKTGKRDQVRIILGVEMQQELGIKPGDSVLVTVQDSMFGPAIYLQKSDCKAAYKASKVSKTSTALHIRIAASKIGLPIRHGKFSNIPGWENMTKNGLKKETGPNRIIVPLPDIVLFSERPLKEMLSEYPEYQVVDEKEQKYKVSGAPKKRIFGRLFV